MRTIPVAIVACTAFLLLSGCLQSGPAQDDASSAASPYVDQQHSDVRGLSASEIEELRTGAGMGMARPAELNGYPGPLHVLELADELDLDDDQRAAVQAVRSDMLAEAVPIGEDILDAYAALEEAFRNRSIDADSLRMRLERIAGLYEDLRFVHLAAHLDTAPLLTEHQTMRYIELRGYDASGTKTGAGDGQDHTGHAGHGGHGG